ncbi:MAG: hypothetical protein ACRDPY_27165 [Streptosporangiaceae bacterium]
MNLDPVRRVADAVLYEGYILYPYRASAQKNRSRWQFGVVMSPGYAAADPSESAVTQTECVLEHSGQPSLQIVLRFLQVQRRGTMDGAAGSQGPAWDEAVETEVTAEVPALLGEGGEGWVREFVIPGGEDREGWVREFVIPGGEDREGDVIRRRQRLAGAVSVRTSPVPGPWRAVRLTIRVQNRTESAATPGSRDEALPTALVAAHLIVCADGGEFISMTDPPEWAKPAVAACQNVGAWPVLADPDGGRRVILSAPIILYDNPELAEESPGELYDGTEIDEILTLRTLALSDAEKAEARATDPRAAALIDRVEALSLDEAGMQRLHGTIRGLRPAAAAEPREAAAPQPVDFDPAVPWWDPEADASVSPDTDSVTIGGQQVARGSLVRLRPGARRADAQDMFLIGRTAEVQAVLTDVEDKPYLAVSLVDNPDPELSIAHGRFLYFMPDEVEPCEATS